LVKVKVKEEYSEIYFMGEVKKFPLEKGGACPWQAGVVFNQLTITSS
jgi:hypothetical protein